MYAQKLFFISSICRVHNLIYFILFSKSSRPVAVLHFFFAFAVLILKFEFEDKSEEQLLEMVKKKNYVQQSGATRTASSINRSAKPAAASTFWLPGYHKRKLPFAWLWDTHHTAVYVVYALKAKWWWTDGCFFFCSLHFGQSQRPDLSRHLWTSYFHRFLFAVFLFLAFQWSKTKIAQFAQAAVFAGMWLWWLLCLCFSLFLFFFVLPLWLSMLLLMLLKKILQKLPCIFEAQSSYLFSIEIKKKNGKANH